MRRCLLFVSLLLLAVLARADGFLLPLDGRQQYVVDIQMGRAALSGVCIVKGDGDAGFRGAIVNEFGVHALDFTLTSDRRHLRLQNVIGVMDRWYIRRVVRRDLLFLFSAAGPQHRGKRRLTVDADGTVVVENQKYNLKYSLKRIVEDETAE